MVSFAAQKLVGVVSYHLFILAFVSIALKKKLTFIQQESIAIESNTIQF